ncbi:MAG TPA: hypothetical protein VFQ25_10360 [Ktedonobacterales bacterium]|nr:hypothetical protein [Ktedonobacterales bacterium]
MTSTSIKLMLLGIGLILFGLAFPTSIAQLFMMMVVALRSVVFSQYALEMLAAVIGSLFSLAGLILLFVGFFRRETASAA